MPRKKYSSAEKAARREEALRPCEYIGYDHDRLGLYFLEREAFKLAASEFARAVWLNPYEPMFKVHEAITRLRMKQTEQAQSLLCQVLSSKAGPARVLAQELWEKNWPGKPCPAGSGDGQPACGQEPEAKKAVG